MLNDKLGVKYSNWITDFICKTGFICGKITLRKFVFIPLFIKEYYNLFQGRFTQPQSRFFS